MTGTGVYLVIIPYFLAPLLDGKVCKRGKERCIGKQLSEVGRQAAKSAKNRNGKSRALYQIEYIRSIRGVSKLFQYIRPCEARIYALPKFSLTLLVPAQAFLSP